MVNKSSHQSNKQNKLQIIKTQVKQQTTKLQTQYKQHPIQTNVKDNQTSKTTKT